MFLQPAMVIMGPTGSGKTPLGDICEAGTLWGFRGVHFDFGAQLRRIERIGDASAGHTEDEMRVIQDALRTGKLLENDQFPIAEKILVSFLEEKRVQPSDILVLNGLPRHVGQASDVDAVVDIRLMVYLDCRPESVSLRIARNTGGDRIDRNDDAADAVEKKLRIFRKRTLPLLEHYRGRGAAVETMPVEADTRPLALYRRLNRKAYHHLWESS